MAKKITKKRFQKKQEKKYKNCPFCTNDNVPSYKEHEGLREYLSERARILNKGFTGVCSKHQRILTKEIKHARHLGLLPFA